MGFGVHRDGDDDAATTTRRRRNDDERRLRATITSGGDDDATTTPTTPTTSDERRRRSLFYAVASKLLQRSSCLELIQFRKGVERMASDQKRKIDRAQGRETQDHRPFSPKIGTSRANEAKRNEQSEWSKRGVRGVSEESGAGAVSEVFASLLGTDSFCGHLGAAAT